MKKLRESVKKLMDEELDMANSTWPLFSSDHEGIAVIEEELKESRAEYLGAKEEFNDLKREVFMDEDDDEKVLAASAGMTRSIELACEAIQTAAMFKKFIQSKQARKEAKK